MAFKRGHKTAEKKRLSAAEKKERERQVIRNADGGRGYQLEREKRVTFRLSDDEFEAFERLLFEKKLTRQKYLLQKVLADLKM